MLAAADARDVCVYSTIPMTGSDDAYPTLISKGRWCFHTQRIGCLAWSPDGSVIASGGNDDSIFLWCPMQKTKRVHYRFAHRGGVTGLGFVGKGDGGPGGDWTLVSAGADGCINWWSVEDDVREKFGL
jgi:WD40 repeat protein